jgi:hypothetical protein
MNLDTSARSGLSSRRFGKPMAPFAGQHARYVLRSLITILEKKGGKS